MPLKEQGAGREGLLGGRNTVRMPYFTVKIRPSDRFKPNVRVIISRATIKSAARRNYWRRRIQADLSGAANGLSAEITVWPSGRIVVLTRRQLKAEIAKLL
jgi:RNase P protein component